MRPSDLDSVGVLLRVLFASASGFLAWSFVARDRLTVRPRQWLYKRFPPDGFSYAFDEPTPPKRARLQRWSTGTDVRLAPVNLRLFSQMAGATVEWFATEAKPLEGPLPPKYLYRTDDGLLHLAVGSDFVEAWCQRTSFGLELLEDGAPLPRNRVVLGDSGRWEVPKLDGSWFGNLLDCSACLGRWLGFGSAVVVVLGPPWVVLIGAGAATAVLINALGVAFDRFR